jgi:hypothetical protein
LSRHIINWAEQSKEGTEHMSVLSRQGGFREAEITVARLSRVWTDIMTLGGHGHIKKSKKQV